MNGKLVPTNLLYFYNLDMPRRISSGHEGTGVPFMASSSPNAGVMQPSMIPSYGHSHSPPVNIDFLPATQQHISMLMAPSASVVPIYNAASSVSIVHPVQHSSTYHSSSPPPPPYSNSGSTSSVSSDQFQKTSTFHSSPILNGRSSSFVEQSARAVSNYQLPGSQFSFVSHQQPQQLIYS